MKIELDVNSVESYRTFLKVKQLPSYRFQGRTAHIPDEYADRLGLERTVRTSAYTPESFMFDYQRDIAEMAVKKRTFAVFADCGLGKSLIALSYARHVAVEHGKRVLLLTPPMVVPQMHAEHRQFWPHDEPCDIVKAAGMQEWLNGEYPAIGISNYEALKDTTQKGNLGALILDESSILKSHYGKTGSICLRLGRGLDWKLCLTGTPAPNDRIEFANHAVFLDRFQNVNSFLAKYFINRGQTQDRWALKPHALKPFYRSLSDWSIFLSDPSVYGWKDNCDTIPPIHVHVEHVDLTKEQKAWVMKHTRELVATRAGGITTRSAYGQVSKGHWKGQTFETNKPQAIKDLVGKWPDESTLIWCMYDKEQASVHDAVGGESLWGKTPVPARIEAIKRFKNRESMTMISKSKILGFGLNLQVATRQIFSGLQDSYESFYQCVKRSNRIGSTKPLNVHIPVTELELAMVENVLRKADRVDADTREQQELFSLANG